MPARSAPEVERKVLELYRDRGWSLSQTADVVDMTRQGVVRVLQRFGVKRRKSGHPDKGVPDVAGLFAMKRRLGTWVAVAKAIGVSDKTIYRHLRGVTR